MIRLIVLCAFAFVVVAGSRMDVMAKERLLKLGPLPAPPPDPTNRWSDDPKAAEFGRWLFHEPRLSRNGEVSCASCHQPELGFADGRSLAKGLGTGIRHTQSLLNAAHQRWLTWDGRADSLWSQALHPFESPLEMGLSRRELIERIRAIEPLRTQYESLFGALPAAEDATGIDTAFGRIGKALAAFERRLVTGPAPFDRWLQTVREGSEAPIDGFGADAIRGAQLFVGKAGCVRCHAGPLLSDGEFHLIGVPSKDGGLPTDRGRLDGVERLRKDPYNAAGPHSDDPDGPRARWTAATQPDPETWGRFRTPSLRSAAASPPFMHQGQLATLEEVVRFYDTLEGATSLDHHSERVLEPLGLTDRERADLVAFLIGVRGAIPDKAVWTDPWPDRPGELGQKPGVGTSPGAKSGPS
jgi:cytochrome c peroxidase